MKPRDDVGEIILELGDIRTPDADDDVALAVAEGSDIHTVAEPTITRAVQHDIEAVLLAYLLDLEEPAPTVPERQSVLQATAEERAGRERKDPT